MKYLFLLFAILVLGAQKILVKQYNIKSKNADAILFSAIATFFAMLFFYVLSGFSLDVEGMLLVLPYSLAFGIAYTISLVGINVAITKGPFSASVLINSYSVLIPTLYGVLILHDAIGSTVYIGVTFLLVSLFFINIKKEAARFSVTWLVWVLASFVGNGMCSTIQKMQQMDFSGAYKNELMVMTLGISFVFQVCVIFLQRKEIHAEWKTCIKYAPFAGIANGATNLAVMILTGLLPSAILFPMLSAGDIVLLFLISIFVYKERLSKMQLIGYAIGILSILFLNL